MFSGLNVETCGWLTHNTYDVVNLVPVSYTPSGAGTTQTAITGVVLNGCAANWSGIFQGAGPFKYQRYGYTIHGYGCRLNACAGDAATFGLHVSGDVHVGEDFLGSRDPSYYGRVVGVEKYPLVNAGFETWGGGAGPVAASAGAPVSLADGWTAGVTSGTGTLTVSREAATRLTDSQYSLKAVVAQCRIRPHRRR